MSAAQAAAVARLLAIDPQGLGGVVLRGPAGPDRDAWLTAFHDVMPAAAPWRRIPPQIAEGRLLGGLDLAATLAAGRPIVELGLLAQADRGILIVPMAERLETGVASHLAAALDMGEAVIERDGIAARMSARIAMVLLDEGIDDERAPPPLVERLAFVLDLTPRMPSPPSEETPGEDVPALRAPEMGAPEIAAARARLADVVAGDEAVEALAAAGLVFGVASLRIATLALRAARAAAALAGRGRVATQDAELAAALVIAPRATMIPAGDEDETETTPETPPEAETPDEQPAADVRDSQTMADSVVEATRAAIPADLLATLVSAAGAPPRSSGGKAGATRASVRRGRPAGTRRGMPGHGIRLAVVETLRAAAPWQRLRRQTLAVEAARVAGRTGAEAPPPPDALADRILVRREDFRVGRFKEKSETLTIFVVDASGSAALHRLAEVKGAVELILADCYVRRDGVALIAFRGERADLILPPTRSLVRAKRALAGLPGGGGTPLAAAIEAADRLAQAARKRGQAPLVVLLTDGKANIARTGRSGRTEAEADAAMAARAFRLGRTAGLVLDIAPRPGDAAQRLAAAMGARYIPLPYADAKVLSRTVLAAAPTA